MATVRSAMAAKVKSLPMTPGCYIFKHANGGVLYVGKAKCLRRRVRQYFQSDKGKPAKIKKLVRMIDDMAYVCVQTEIEALLLEYRLIKQHKPPFNAQHKRDTQPPFLAIDTAAVYPGLRIAYGDGGRGEGESGGEAFGPFATADEALRALTVLNTVWRTPLCGCAAFDTNVPRKPCFHYHLNKCDAPCAGLIAPEMYRARITDIILFLRGKTSIIKTTRRAMRQAAAALAFEQAAALRDQVDALAALSKRLRQNQAGVASKRLCVFAKGFHEAAFALFFIDHGVAHLRLRFASADDWCEDRLRAFVADIFDGTRDNAIHPHTAQALSAVSAHKRYIDITRVRKPTVVLRRLLKAFPRFYSME